MKFSEVRVGSDPVVKINTRELTATLVEDYIFHVNDIPFKIPAGEVSDYASYIKDVPFISWFSRKIVWFIFPPVGTSLHAVLIHDHTLRVGIKPEIADMWFKKALEDVHYGTIRKNIGFYGVRLYDKFIRRKSK